MKRAKVLLLTHACTVGGAEMHLLSLARHLNKDKYDITLAYFIERPPDDARSLKEDFIKCGINVVDLQGAKRFDLISLLKAVKLMKEKKFDIVHTHLIRADIAGCIAVTGGMPQVFLSTVHCTEEFMKNPFFAAIEWLIARRAKQIIVISDAVGKYLEETSGVDCQKIKRIYYGLDDVNEPVPDISIRQCYSIDSNAPIIGMIARYAPQKGHKYLLDAMSEVLKTFPDSILFLAGHDEKGIKQYLEKYAKELGIENNVIFSGFRSDVINTIKQFDLFVLSSLWEGFGLVLLEAMSAGKPIVTTEAGPIPEIVKDGETGFLVPPRNPGKMAEKIIFLLKNKTIAQEMGEAGKKRLEKYFTLNKMIRETEAVYDHWLCRVQEKELEGDNI